MPRNTAKSRQKQQKRRHSYLPKPVQGRVIARHITGESNRQIAIEEGIDRETVNRILSQREVVQMIARSQKPLFALVPNAINVYQRALSSRNERVRLTAATKILEGLGVLLRGGLGQMIDVANQASSPEQQTDDRRIRILSQMASMIMKKGEQYGFAVPEPFERLK